MNPSVIGHTIAKEAIQRMEREESYDIYKKRKVIVEPVIGKSKTEVFEVSVYEVWKK